jgi:hypothetical protein
VESKTDKVPPVSRTQLRLIHSRYEPEFDKSYFNQTPELRVRTRRRRDGATSSKPQCCHIADVIARFGPGLRLGVGLPVAPLLSQAPLTVTRTRLSDARPRAGRVHGPGAPRSRVSDSAREIRPRRLGPVAAGFRIIYATAPGESRGPESCQWPRLRLTATRSHCHPSRHNEV